MEFGGKKAVFWQKENDMQPINAYCHRRLYTVSKLRMAFSKYRKVF